MGKFVKPIAAVEIAGTPIGATRAGSAATVMALIYDGNHDILLATGTGVPADTTDGYAKGCLFIDTDVATGTTGLYCNKGTKTSCAFTAVTQA